MQDTFVNERNRANIPDKYKWDLSHIYPSDEGWRQAKLQLVAEFESLSGYRGKLSESPQRLFDCLELISRLQKERTRLTCYASMMSDLDTRDATYLAMEQEMGQIGADFAALTSFLEPEILKMGRGTVESFLRRHRRLESYRHVLDDILRKEKHTGTEAEEKIIADAGLIADSPGTVYSVFSNADFPFPEVVLSNGVKARLDPPAFGLHRRSPVREDRKKVFASFLGKMLEYRRTFGAELYAEVRKNMFFSRARHYASSLERALDTHNIPTSVYKNLIEGVRSNLDTLHRYLRLRQAFLAVDQLHYHDLYAPLVKDVDLDYTYEEAAELVLASVAPLGREYAEVAGKALAQRWIDVYHNEGKKSGAYSNGAAYDAHPYIMLNHNG